MRRVKIISAILVLAGIFAFALSTPSMAATDKTPTPNVTINYNVGSDLSSMKISGGGDLVSNTTYYVPADRSSYNPSGLTTVEPSVAFWKIVVDGTGNRSVEGLYPNPGDLVLVTGSATFALQSATNGLVDGCDVKFADTSSGGLGEPAMTDTTGNTAVLFGQIYSVYTSKGWETADAKVGVTYYTDFGEAVTVANSGSDHVILVLANITLTSPATVNSVDAIYCCSGSITVASGGALFVSGPVFNKDGSAKTTVFLTDGGTVNDYAGNIVSATLTDSSAAVSGQDTVLSVTQATPGTTNTVNINGKFASLSGTYFALTNNTSITNTLDSATITGGNYQLTVNGGTVYVNYAMTEGNLSITGGDLWLSIPVTDKTYVTGTSPYAGRVHVTQGTAWVLGSVAYLHTYGSSQTDIGGVADLLGTAAGATVEGHSQLAIASRDSQVGQITGDVTGVQVGSLQGTLLTTNANSVIKAQGLLQSVGGSVTMSGDLSIRDAADLGIVTGNSLYSLELFGSSTKYANSLTLSGTFNDISVHNLSVTLGNVTVNRNLNEYYEVTGYTYKSASVPVMTVENSAHIGALSGMASGTIEGILNITNSSFCGYFTGANAVGGSDNYAELHIDELSNSNSSNVSFVGVEGTYKSLTGRVHTCGDLTVHSTVESTPVYIDASDAQLNRAVITGGMTYSGTNYIDGYTCGLTIDDAVGNSWIELYGGNFKYISADDTKNAGANVSLTMYDGWNSAVVPVPVGIGSSSAGKNGTIGLDVTGDSSTAVDIGTNGIYGSGYGVYLSGVIASITGSDASNLNTLTGTSSDGVCLNDSNLTMANYAISGAVNGVTAAACSTLSLTNATVVGGASDEITGTGIRDGVSGDAAASMVTLDAVTVTGDTGIEVNSGSALTFKNTISVTGGAYGICVNNGSVTNQSGALFSGTGNVTATGSGGRAMFVTKGSVTLDGYTFTAKAVNGIGFATADTDTVTVGLSDGANPGSAGAVIWGSDTGVITGKKTVMTISDYNVYGSNDATQVNVTSGNAGAKVYGTLRLNGINTFLGGQYGVYVNGGTVTNYQSADGWTTNETGATAQGSGYILSGVSASSTALYAENGTVKLGSYDVSSDGASGDSYGLYAKAGSTVYLCGDPTGNIVYTVTGCTGYGVYTDGACVTIYDMLVQTKSSDAACVSTTGVLNLGTGVTLHAMDTSGKATVLGTDANNAELHVIAGNTAIGAEGSFKDLTGYVSNTNDLTVTGTDNAKAYNQTDYLSSTNILGSGSYDLSLGTDKVTATLENGGTFASIKVAGTQSVQQSITVAGNLTVLNSDMAYAFAATYADVTFIKSSTDAPFARGFTATNPGSAGISAGSGAKLYLTDALNVQGVSYGISLTDSAVVTDMTDASGWVTAFSEDGTPLSSGSVTATGGAGINVGGSSVLLLGDHGITGTTCALNVTGGASTFLAAGTDAGKKELTSTGSNVTINTTGSVTLKNYNAAASVAPCDAIVKVANGTVKLDGGNYNGSTSDEAIIIAAGSGCAPVVTLANGVQVLSAKSGTGNACVDITGSDATHGAVLTIADSATVKSAAESGVRAGQYAQVNMTGTGNIIGYVLEGNESVKAIYGVYLEEPTSSFTMSGGIIGFETAGTGKTAIYAPHGSVAVNGGTVGVYNGVTADTGINMNDSLSVNGGAVSGSVDAICMNGGSVTVGSGSVSGGICGINQIAGSTAVSGGTVAGGHYGVCQKAGNTEISGGMVTGADNALYQKDGETWISGGTFDTDDSVTTDTVILMNKNLWLSSGTVKGIISSEGSGYATGLYINPDAAVSVSAGGNYTSMTGRASVAGNLSVTDTTDAVNALDSKNDYASGTTTANNTLILTGVSGNAGDIVLQNGTADFSGVFGAMTFGGGNSTVEATVTDDTALAGNCDVKSDAALTIADGKTLTVTPKLLTAEGTLTVGKASSLDGDVSLGGTATIKGTVSGTVTGTGSNARLSLSNASGTTAKVEGAFLELTSLDATNYAALAGGLTVSGTGESPIYVTGPAGTAYDLELAGGSTAVIIGDFGSLSGAVTLAGDTSINGSGTAVISDTVGDTAYALIISGSQNATIKDGNYSNITAGGTSTIALEKGDCAAISAEGTSQLTMKGGNYSSLTVSGGTVNIEPTIAIDDVTVENGKLIIDGKLMTDKISVGSGSTAAIMDAQSAQCLTGKIWVENGSISKFPTAMSNGIFNGWEVYGKSDIISDKAYTITGGEKLIISWQFRTVFSGGGSTYSVAVNKEVAGGIANTSTSDQLGGVSVSSGRSSGDNVTMTVTPGTSFSVGTVSVKDSGGKAVDVTDNGDGTYTFKMPSSDVSVDVEYAPLLSEKQTAPAVEYAEKSPQSIYLNNKPVSVMAYNVNGNNYFKLRDLAYLINGSGCQFSIGYSGEVITLTTGKPYAPVGGENVITDDMSSTCEVSSWSIQVNGVTRYLKCYNIADNNYFQLRELSQLLGIGIKYDEATDSVYITTK